VIVNLGALFSVISVQTTKYSHLKRLFTSQLVAD
jgi:hypothetical protein